MSAEYECENALCGGLPTAASTRMGRRRLGLYPRPPILYHASPQPNLSTLIPMARSKRRPDDPACVFATPSKAVASTFVVPASDDFVLLASPDRGKTWIYVIGDLNRFRQLDTGGYIYTVAPDTFSYDPMIGLAEYEWTSIEAVPVLACTHCTSGLQAMRETGVEVIASAELFQQLRRSRTPLLPARQRVLP